MEHSAAILAALRQRDAAVQPLLRAAQTWKTLTDADRERQNVCDELRALITLRREENRQFSLRISQIQQSDEDARLHLQVAQAEREIAELNEELYSLYAVSNDGEIAFRKELSAKKEHLASVLEQIAQGQAHASELEKACVQLDAERDKYEVQHATMKEEHEAMQNSYLKSERELRALRTENEELITRILSLKQQQVELMNESNARATREKAAELKSDLLDASLDVDVPAVVISRVPECHLHSWEAHLGEVMDLCALGGGVASASQDKRVKLWDPSGKCMLTLTGHTMGVTRLSPAPAGSLLASCSFDRSVQIWSATTGRSLHHLNGHTDKVHSVVFGLDSVHVYSTSQDHTLKSWDASRGVFEASVVCSSTAIDLARTGTALLGAHHDRHLRLWDPRTRSIEHDMTTAHSLPLMGLAVTADSAYCVVTSRDSTASIVDLRMMETVAVWSSMELRLCPQFARPSISPDDRYVALGTETGQLHFWDLLGSKPEKILKADRETGPIFCCAWTRGYEVVTAGTDKMLRVWGCRV
eukprot:m.97165 g.97165  ORF g.97165 m.97165 type:complete len:531 (-) comp13967_c3_seq3:106-1698(-)